jgi:hypothetical protein
MYNKIRYYLILKTPLIQPPNASNNLILNPIIT